MLGYIPFLIVYERRPTQNTVWSKDFFATVAALKMPPYTLLAYTLLFEWAIAKRL